VSVVGVKYTTARAVSARAVATVLQKLGRPPSSTTDSPLLQSDGTRLGARYGAAAGQVAALAASNPALAAPVGEGLEVTGAEVVHAVRHEMALTLEDIILRRTAIGTTGYPATAVVAACAALAARELGWGEERVRDEIAGVARFYELGGSATPADARREPVTAS
jgi:glycerol-3-phosphate dehydrogenase